MISLQPSKLSSAIVPVTIISAPALSASTASSGLLIPPPTTIGITTAFLTALIVWGGIGLWAPELASR